MLRNLFVQSCWNCTFLETAAVLRGHPLISRGLHPFGLHLVCVQYDSRERERIVIWFDAVSTSFDFELLCYSLCLVSLWLVRDVNRSGWPQSGNTQVDWRHPHFSTICLISAENCLILFVYVYESLLRQTQSPEDPVLGPRTQIDWTVSTATSNKLSILWSVNCSMCSHEKTRGFDTKQHNPAKLCLPQNFHNHNP